MAHHASCKKRMRQDAIKRLANRYYKKSTRTAIKNLRSMTDKVEAAAFLTKVHKMVDVLSKRNSWHKNKSANIKGSLAKFVNSL